MLAAAVAKRYANALLAVAKEKNELPRVEQDLRLVAESVTHDPEVIAFLVHPAISIDTKKQYIESAFKEHVSQLVMNFLKLLFDQRRERYIQAIQLEFTRMYDEEQGRVKAHVETAVEIDPKELELVSSTLSSGLGKQVAITSSVNPELIGGARIQVGDHVLDASVRGGLNQFRQALRRNQVARKG